MAGVNNIITSMAPLYWKEKINSGLIAGVLNGFCYLGSTLSAYGLGLVRDLSGGWGAVFGLLFILCIVAVVIAAVYGVIHYCKSKKNVR
jgi:OPA family glycerol-3-phosphate transporter-like MFS transporter